MTASKAPSLPCSVACALESSQGQAGFSCFSFPQYFPTSPSLFSDLKGLGFVFCCWFIFCRIGVVVLFFLFLFCILSLLKSFKASSKLKCLSFCRKAVVTKYSHSGRELSVYYFCLCIISGIRNSSFFSLLIIYKALKKMSSVT